MKRKLNTIQTPPPHQGFLGPGHVARAVVEVEFKQSDPFIMLMDDRLVVPDGEPVGGPHPHAGFETVTLILEGQLGDAHHQAGQGDLEMMTAGSGIIHTESIPPKTNLHILQLWLTLPKKDRWITPRVQTLHFDNVPKVSSNEMDIRVYSGTFAGLSSVLQNHTPVIIADIHLKGDVTTIQTLPASYNTFLYVLEGEVLVGEEQKLLAQGQVGWLDKTSGKELSELQLKAGNSGARFVLYGGEPQNDPIVSYGPFIGDKQQDIIRLYEDYHAGKMKHVTTLKEEQVFSY